MGLRAFMIRRLLLTIPTLLGTILLIFAVTQLFSPVERAMLYVTNAQQLEPATIEKIIQQYHLRDPAYVQFLLWLQQLMQGNLGFSKVGRMPVTAAIITKFPATLEIVMFSAPLIIFIGIYLGVKSAVHRDKPLDHFTRSLSIIGMSLPSFWLGMILISIFYVGLGLFPTGRLSPGMSTVVYGTASDFIRYTGLMTVDSILNGRFEITVDALRHLVLPVTVIVTISIAGIVRIMRSSMLEALNKGFVVTARAKGLSQNEVINKHARRNALIPTITVSGMMIAGMLNGLIITETVFAFGGIGQWSANAALQLDIASVLGFTLFSGFLFVMANILVDVMYAYIDPRIRLD